MQAHAHSASQPSRDRAEYDPADSGRPIHIRTRTGSLLRAAGRNGATATTDATAIALYNGGSLAPQSNVYPGGVITR